MSDLTPCNFCTYRAMKHDAEKKGQRIETRAEKISEGGPDWIRVYIDGKPAGVWFMELSEDCVC